MPINNYYLSNINEIDVIRDKNIEIINISKLVFYSKKDIIVGF